MRDEEGKRGDGDKWRHRRRDEGFAAVLVADNAPTSFLMKERENKICDYVFFCQQCYEFGKYYE